MTFEISYYDIAKKKFLAQPFESERAKSDFQVPLEKWKQHCETNMGRRRDFYHVPGYITLQDVKLNAPFSKTLQAQDGSQTLNIYLVRDPVTRFETDGVINAANETLLGGGGADQEIHEGAGSNLVRECATLNGCRVGQAVITKGYDLPSKYVLHTVGPLLLPDDNGDEVSLRSCYQECLKLCDRYSIQSLVSPCVACGFYAFPLDKAAQIVKQTLQEYVNKPDQIVKDVILSVPKEKEWNAYFQVFNGER